MNSPLVTAIIPAYERPRRTERAIQSVVDQSYSPIELIVVDDHSTPSLRDSISLEYESLYDFQLIEHDTNKGANAARNTGIKAASGEYIAFLDSDDKWKPEKIARQFSQFRDAPDSVGLVYTGVRQIDSAGRTNAMNYPEIEGAVPKQLLTDNFIGTFSCVMVRSSVFESIDYLDERFPSWQDWEFYLRLTQEYEVRAVPEPLVDRHNEGDQISDDYQQKRDRTVPLFRKKFEPIARNHGWRFRRKWRGRIAYYLARSALGNGKHSEGRQWLLRALRWYPIIPGAYVHLLFLIGGGGTYERARIIKRNIVRLRE